MRISYIEGIKYCVALLLVWYCACSFSATLSVSQKENSKPKTSTKKNSLDEEGDSLRAVIALTLKSNPDIIFRLKSYLAAKQQTRMAQGKYFPSFNLSANVGTQNIAYEFTNPTHEWNNFKPSSATIIISQLLFDGFATSSEIAAGKFRTTSEKFQLRGTANDVALLTAKAYLDILRTIQIVEIAEYNYRAHSKTYQMIQERATSGIDRKADAALAFGRMALASTRVLSAKNSYLNALDDFLQITGMSARNLKLIMPKAPSASSLPKNKSNAQNLAIANHPILKAANANIDEARAGYNLAKSANYPNISLVATGTHGSEVTQSAGRFNENTLSLQMSYNLFNGGTDEARKNLAAELIGEAQATRDKTYRQVIENMQLSWDAYITTKQQLPFLKEHEESAYVTVNAYTDQFELGRRSLLDLLNSEDELFGARVDSVNARFGIILTKYRILSAEGILLSHFKITPPFSW